MWRYSDNDETFSSEIIAAVDFVITDNLYHAANNLAERLLDEGYTAVDNPILERLTEVIELCASERWDNDYTWYRPRARFIKRAQYFLRGLGYTELLRLAIKRRIGYINARQVDCSILDF